MDWITPVFQGRKWKVPAGEASIGRISGRPERAYLPPSVNGKIGNALNYRVYKLDPHGGIVAGAWIEAASDAEAMVVANAMCDEVTPTVELWDGSRKVAVLPCKDYAAA